ncbi:MAG: hypothetical protein AAB434_06540 [Planctomycetota bacterium]
MVRAALVLLALAGPVLAECARCTDKGEVPCPACDGKKTPTLACGECEKGNAECRACQGAGSIECVACKGVGKVGEAALKCRLCQKGRMACRLCAGGKVKCTACKAAGTLKTRCPLCIGVGKFVCPDCAKPDPSAVCGVCAGKARESCPVCEGKGELVTGCPACQGIGRTKCATCAGQGKTRCVSCGGSGRYPKRNHDGTFEGSIECETCDDAGSRPCLECEKKGTKRCGTCGGAGKEKTGCAFCQGWKEIDCRACAFASGWTGQDPKSGARFTLVPCGTFEPLIARGLTMSLGIQGAAVYRLFVDNREGKVPVRLGGTGGWSAVWVDATDEAHAASDPKEVFTPQAFSRLDRLLPTWGAGAGDFLSGAQAAPGEVASLLVLVGADASKDPKRVQLRGPDGTLDLVAGSVPRGAWLRLRLANAAK